MLDWTLLELRYQSQSLMLFWQVPLGWNTNCSSSSSESDRHSKETFSCWGSVVRVGLTPELTGGPTKDFFIVNVPPLLLVCMSLELEDSTCPCDSDAKEMYSPLKLNKSDSFETACVQLLDWFKFCNTELLLPWAKSPFPLISSSNRSLQSRLVAAWNSSFQEK